MIPSVTIGLEDNHLVNLQEPSFELKNKCYFLVINHGDIVALNTSTRHIVDTLSNMVAAIPRFVLTLAETDQHLQEESIPIPWIVLTNNYRVSVTCPGCQVSLNFFMMLGL